MIGNVLDVISHHVGVHADERARQRVAHKLLLNFNRLGNNLSQLLLARRVVQHRVKQARKISVQTFVSGDQLVGEGEPRHHASLLEPVD